MSTVRGEAVETGRGEFPRWVSALFCGGITVCFCSHSGWWGIYQSDAERYDGEKEGAAVDRGIRAGAFQIVWMALYDLNILCLIDMISAFFSHGKPQDGQ